MQDFSSFQSDNFWKTKKLELFLERWLHSVECDRMSIISELQDQYQPNTPRLGVSSMRYAGLCTTWYREVNLFRIFMIFVSWITKQEEYCLSPASILTFKYQSIVNLFRIFVPFISLASVGKKNAVCLLLEFWPPSINPFLMIRRLNAHPIW